MRHYDVVAAEPGEAGRPQQSAVERRREQFSAALCAAPPAVRDLLV